MHLSTDQLVALAIDEELAEFLETQLGNDFGAHNRIILPRRSLFTWPIPAYNERHAGAEIQSRRGAEESRALR